MLYCSVQDVITYESYQVSGNGDSFTQLINHRFTEDTRVQREFTPGLYISMLGQCGCTDLKEQNICNNVLYNQQYVVALVDESQMSQLHFSKNSQWQSFGLSLPMSMLNECEVLHKLSMNTPNVLPGLRFAEFGPIPNDILRCCEAVWSCDFQGYERELFIKAKAQEVLALFLNKLRQNNSSATSERLVRLNSTLNYIQQNLSQDWSLSAVARLANSNQTYVKKDIKTLVHRNFRDWLKEIRLEAACEQLSKEQPITEIAHNVGFKSQAHFATFFKTELGVTPSGYRQSLLIKHSA